MGRLSHGSALSQVGVPSCLRPNSRAGGAGSATMSAGGCNDGKRTVLLHSGDASLLQSISSRRRLLQTACNTLMIRRNRLRSQAGLLQSGMLPEMLQQLQHLGAVMLHGLSRSTEPTC